MHAVVVAVLDRDDWGANTDVIVVVSGRKRRLTWVPRDLWSERIGDRVNAAFGIGGGPLLMTVLGDLGFTVQGVLCLRRAATEMALDGTEVTVSLKEPLDFWYPLEPSLPIEEGRKLVSFRPPEERLSGERLHQWVGARYSVRPDGSDLHRLRRQIVLLKALLADGFEFRRALRNPELVRVFGRDPIPTLARVSPGWRFTVFSRVESTTINGKAVLVRRKPVPRWRVAANWIAAKLRIR